MTWDTGKMGWLITVRGTSPQRDDTVLCMHDEQTLNFAGAVLDYDSSPNLCINGVFFNSRKCPTLNNAVYTYPT